LKIVKHELAFTVCHYETQILVENYFLDEAKLLEVFVTLLAIGSLFLNERVIDGISSAWVQDMCEVILALDAG
jgi:hypothetical protein